MVEENASNLACRIDVECPTSGNTTAATTPGGLPSSSEEKCQGNDTKSTTGDAEDTGPEKSPVSPKPGCSNQNPQQHDGPSTSPHSPPPPPAPGTIIRCEENSVNEIQNEENGLAQRPVNIVTNQTAVARRLKQENERLQAELTRLRRLVITAGAAAANKAINQEGGSSCPEDGKPVEGITGGIEAELQLAREALTALRADRKRLKAEKFDLLNQMKQLYATLEDKEKELRDFIRNYEQRIRESDASLQQLSTEREERERERWSLLRHARDEAERSLSLAAQLNAKELQLREAREQLREARRQLGQQCCLSDQEQRGGSVGCPATPGSLGPPGDRGSCSADSGVVRGSETASACGNLSDSTTDGTPTITVDASGNPIVDADSISVVSSAAGQSHHMYQLASTPKDCSPTLSPLNANNFSRSMDTGILSRSVEQLSSPLESEPTAISVLGRRSKNGPPPRPSSGRGGTWGSISRVFARSRHRNKSAHSHSQDGPTDPDAYRSWSPLTEEGYAEKLRLLREAASIPMERWRAPTVLAWLEIALGMPQYGPRCAENVKSGKVLLELSDVELECGLGIVHPMHRKKLRLAIEEHRHPSLVRYPCIAQLGHTWVSSEWLPDLGLAQYSENFATNMVDARMLEHLSKKELEKFLGVTRKFHQASIVHGIHLLRIMKYDRQALAVRRHQCETVDADPLVWSNQRFIRWARNIDLSEYADNLKDSGVHGGLVVLEPSFNGDTMATALGIPPSKNIIRRHLTAELEALVLPARSTLEHVVRIRGRSLAGIGPLGRSYSSCDGGSTSALQSAFQLRQDSIHRVSSGLRGSLSRALGLTSKSDRDKQSPTSSSETSSIISRVSPTNGISLHQSGGESPIYAVPFGYSTVDRNSTASDNSQRYGYGTTTQRNKQQRVSLFGHLASVTTGSLPRFKHRRVRSIGDIDAVKPVSSPV